uniref:Uncharacterized protein n=1 Tax=Clastoptera arizonana TaxID=38151 RepID=A0A1B6DQ02_9HEMI
MVRKKSDAYQSTNKKAVAVAARKLLFNNKAQNDKELSMSSLGSAHQTSFNSFSSFEITPKKTKKASVSDEISPKKTKKVSISNSTVKKSTKSLQMKSMENDSKVRIPVLH